MMLRACVYILALATCAHAAAQGDVAVRRQITLAHVQRCVKALATRGQQMRPDADVALSPGNGLCLPCHTLAPGTPRSIKPLHLAIDRGMVPGLTGTQDAPKRAPVCVDCHLYPHTAATIRSGNLRVDMSRDPCSQPDCHASRDLKWTLKFLGRMRQAAPAVPTGELFVGSTRYGTAGLQVNAHIGRSALKTAAVAAPWLLLLATLILWRFAGRHDRGPSEGERP